MLLLLLLLGFERGKKKMEMRVFHRHCRSLGFFGLWVGTAGHEVCTALQVCRFLEYVVTYPLNTMLMLMLVALG
jgi:hypothetical protein